jgi:hypothetical protein
MHTHPPQDEPPLLRLSYRALERLRRAYPQRFDHTIQALRIRCRIAYRRQRLFGLLLAWAGILWQLQITLPSEYGLPSLRRLLALAKRRQGARQAAFPSSLPRAGVRLYYRRARPSRREIILSTLALLVLLPVFMSFVVDSVAPVPPPTLAPATQPAYHAPSGGIGTPTPGRATPEPAVAPPAPHTDAPAPQTIAPPIHPIA